jgi:hypothetical protein
MADDPILNLFVAMDQNAGGHTGIARVVLGMLRGSRPFCRAAAQGDAARPRAACAASSDGVPPSRAPAVRMASRTRVDASSRGRCIRATSSSSAHARPHSHHCREVSSIGRVRVFLGCRHRPQVTKSGAIRRRYPVPSRGVTRTKPITKVDRPVKSVTWRRMRSP